MSAAAHRRRRASSTPHARLYAGDSVAEAVLDGYARRLREPLRLAVAGMVKAGKSTVLNALIGEQIAPTDAGECTKTVTWYRYGRSATITAHLHGGAEVRLPVTRSDGALVLDLGSRSPREDVAWIDVVWPSESLRSTVLIDTPGIASLSQDVSERSTRFLTPTRSPSEADAILYLLRHIHASDVHFLEAFRDTAAGAVADRQRRRASSPAPTRSAPVASTRCSRRRGSPSATVATASCDPWRSSASRSPGSSPRVLARSARASSRRSASSPHSIALCATGCSSRWTASSLSTDDSTLSVTERRDLLARFGIFGVRLGAALVRGGARTSSQLSERMVAQSGLIDVQRFVADQFRSRAPGAQGAERPDRARAAAGGPSGTRVRPPPCRHRARHREQS